jgi:hypothetical protein
MGRTSVAAGYETGCDDADGSALVGVTHTCELGTIPAGTSKTYDIYFHVIGNKGAVTNTVTVSQDAAITDPVSTNNTAVRTNLIQGKNTGRR